MIRNLFTTVLCATFLISQAIQLGDGSPAWLNSWLDDLLCLPLLLTGVAAIQRKFGCYINERIPKIHGLLALIWVSVVFEGILPLVSSRYYADPVDVLAYALGWLIFELAINQSGNYRPEQNDFNAGANRQIC